VPVTDGIRAQVLVQDRIAGILFGMTKVVQHEQSETLLADALLVVRAEAVAVEHDPGGPFGTGHLAEPIRIGRRPWIDVGRVDGTSFLPEPFLQGVRDPR